MEGDKAFDVIDDTILRIFSLYDHLTSLQVWYELGEEDVVGEKLTKAEVLDRLESLKVKGFVETVTKAREGGALGSEVIVWRTPPQGDGQNRKRRRSEMAKKQSNRVRTKSSRASKVRFDLHAPEAQRVSLAGDFNGWDVDALPMRKDRGGNWKKTLDLQPGRYEYRFCVDGAWQDDPRAQDRVINPFGSLNSVRIVTD
ncbi:MAG: hypothetical protein GTN74_00055 [Proteobacteria bacterium]|nr:hypothetical protein [Pseudomonadota bacterium]NIS70150.1 hypothetical protein [Pseudomonadota bacterium]